MRQPYQTPRLVSYGRIIDHTFGRHRHRHWWDSDRNWHHEHWYNDLAGPNTNGGS